ncbi:MAG: ring-cleaving dioxygenase [Microscillaceae bacterium]|nr:ring-cleaving dioxygenase [Microscillaceae bacterium]
MKPNFIKGLHHVTALASDTQQNVNFYVGVLGLRLVKQTINFDAPEVYHLYYGDYEGNPGTILTFFPFAGSRRGKKGKGQLTYTAFSIGIDSLPYWMARLAAFAIDFEGPKTRFSETYIRFEDPDGLGIELVANHLDRRKGWDSGVIPAEHAIKGFYGVNLLTHDPERTVQMLTTSLNHRLVQEQNAYLRFEVEGASVPGYVDVQMDQTALRGTPGAGTVHHLAFATASDESQLELREALLGQGVQATPVLDRQYFHSIYFREPGGVLFEVATNPPGFAVDEAQESLGQSLKLPAWLESQRAGIQGGLPSFTKPSVFPQP